MDDPGPSTDDSARHVARATDAELVELSRELRRLARHVAPDEAAADDLVQDAWLAALESKPGSIAGMTGWLRGVVRNVGRRKARRTRAREDAECMASSEEADVSEQELIERISTYRALRDCVDELREPSRTVVRMRYFDQRSPTEIAAELARPVETVRTQLQRGLGELRELLSRRRGQGRFTWALVLLGRPWSSRAKHAAGWMLAAGAMLIVALLAWRFTGTDPAPTELAALKQRDVPNSTVVPLDPVAEPVRATPAVSSEVSPLVAAPARHELEVRVVNPSGDSVSGATVVLSNAGGREVGRGTTDERGRFTADVTLLADVGPPVLAEGSLGILVEAFGMGWSSAPLVVVPCAAGTTVATIALGGPAQRIVGRVRGPDGEPVPGTVVGMEPHVLGLRPGADGRLYMESPPQAIPDAQGMFALEHLPRREHRYVVQAPGFQARRGVLVGDEDELHLDVTFTRGVELRGRIVRADGEPASGARVWSTDAEGNPSTALEVTALESGDYVLTGLEPGPRYVFACDAADPTWCSVAALMLAEPGSWSPTLRHVEPLIVRVETTDGTPIEEALVVLRLPQSAPETWTHFGTTGSDGGVVFRHRPPVALQCLTLRPGPGNVPHIQLLDAGANGEIVVHLAETVSAQSVRGRIVSTDGVSLAGTRLVALGVAMPTRGEAPIDSTTGDIVELVLAPGEHRLHVVGPLGAFDAGVVHVVAGEALELVPISTPRPMEVAFDWTRAPSTGAWTLQAVGHVAGAEEGLTIGDLSPGDATRELWPATYHFVGTARDGSRSALRFEVVARGANRVVVR